MFNSEQFENKLATSWLGRSLYFFDELDSTNRFAKSLELQGNGHGSLVLADKQTKGRGQYEREWEAEPGANLTFSLVFTPDKSERLTLLTLACALAIADVAEEITEAGVRIKWPNDILVGDKKLAGILTETQFMGNKLARVIVGIGLNVNQRSFSEELEEVACSLCQLKEGPCNRELLMVQLLQKIEYYYRLWALRDQELIKAINRRMVGFGEWVELKVDNEKLDGLYKFLGVNEKGELLALDKEYDIRSFAYEQVRVEV